MRGADTGASVLDRLVGHGVLREVGADHGRLDLDDSEGLAVVHAFVVRFCFS